MRPAEPKSQAHGRKLLAPQLAQMLAHALADNARLSIDRIHALRAGLFSTRSGDLCTRHAASSKPLSRRRICRYAEPAREILERQTLASCVTSSPTCVVESSASLDNLTPSTPILRGGLFPQAPRAPSSSAQWDS